uniref:Gem-associated protein 2 n=1 Tax=Phlebotomus papatasi TaxID=29031 RepID=A0A1B0CZE5_PHLPP
MFRRKGKERNALKMPVKGQDFVEKIPESLQQVALAVPPIGANFDPDTPPETGEQYLQQVIYERTQRVPEVVYNHHDRPPDRVGVSWEAVGNTSITSTAPEDLLPTKEWCEIQCETFRELQARISSIRISKKLPVNLPSIPGYCPSEWLDFCSHQAPHLKYMIQISQAQLEELLHNFVEWSQEEKANLCESSGDSWLAQWIYATLACLHQPLEPSIHFCLRQIARICIAARNSITSESILQATPLNLIICIIAKVFGQVDLMELW